MLLIRYRYQYKSIVRYISPILVSRYCLYLRQAQRQDSVTGGAEINFGGAREVYLFEFERGTGAREIYSSMDQTNKVKTKKKRSAFQKFPQIVVIVSKFLQFATNS